ncbi:MAG: amino-acid N-acetyltransferase [Gammaproteobacteria bacterium]
MSTHSSDFIQWFRSAAPYIHSHRGKTFVLHCGGELIAHPVFPGLVHDIALLNSLGIRVALVFGARPQIEKELEVRGIRPHLVSGLRVTDFNTLEIVKSVVGSLRIQIESLFSMGLPNSPMSEASIKIASGNFVVARPVGVIDGIDLEFTGMVRRIYSDLIRARLHNQELVLIHPVGYSPTGEAFNLGSVELAKQVALELRADKLLFLMCGIGLQDNSGQAVQHLTQGQAEQLLQNKELTDGSPWLQLKAGLEASKLQIERIHFDGSPWLQLQAGLEASKQQIERVHFIDQSQDGGLMQELFSRDGIGTMLTAAPYDELRKASIDDIGGILELIQPLEESGKLVRRSREKMETEINDYFVIIRDNAVIACAAVHIYEDETCAELACLVVDEHYQKLNKGSDLLQAVESYAREHQVKRLFALTTQALHWFIEQGFTEAAIDDLPVQKKQLYNYQRNSKVFTKNIS